MFDGIAARYDLLNRLLSLGVDQRWRRATVAALSLRTGQHVLDLATGTADLALMVARAQPGASVVGIDPSRKMLALGARKVRRAGLDGRVTLARGNAERLGFADASFDGACMAFGMRNVPDRAAALREIARVTRTGGRVAILEFSEPRGGLMGPLARFHIHVVVPRLGAALSGAREYRYLQESIAAFPPPQEFASAMQTAGLTVLRVTAFTFGVCSLYLAVRGRGDA